MNKCKNGITLLSTIIIIVALLIFTGTLVITTDYILEETDKEEFVREYKLIKASVKDYVMRNSGLVDFEEINFDISDVASENLDQFDKETIVNSNIEMYIIDLDKIGVINSTYGNEKQEDENDVYLLSKTTGLVYYKKGFVYNNSIYYTDNID